PSSSICRLHPFHQRTTSHTLCTPSLLLNQPATTEQYTLSLHDALPICKIKQIPIVSRSNPLYFELLSQKLSNLKFFAFSLNFELDRKSTRLNSSHVSISYAVFCLKKKK